MIGSSNTVFHVVSSRLSSKNSRFAEDNYRHMEDRKSIDLANMLVNFSTNIDYKLSFS